MTTVSSEVPFFLAEERCAFQMPKDMATEAFPALRTLTLRQLEILHLKGVSSLPDPWFRVIDLSQTLDFAAASCDKMPCITPDGAKFLTQQVRFVTGVESLRYMGIYYDESKLRAYSSGFLQDLAGNAFETSSCAANFVCNMMLQAHNYTCRKQMAAIPGVPSNSKDSDEDESMESMWHSDLDLDAAHHQ